MGPRVMRYWLWFAFIPALFADSSVVPEILGRALAAIEDGHFSEGGALVQQAWRAADAVGPGDEGYADLIHAIADHHWYRDQHLEAAAVYRTAIEKASSAPVSLVKLRVKLATDLAAEGWALAAIQELEAARVIPEARFQAQILQALAGLHEKAGQFERAEAAIRALQRSHPNQSAISVSMRGSVCSGDPPLGLPPAENEVAAFLARTGQMDRAEAEWRRAVNDAPPGGQPGAMLGLFYHLKAQGKPEAAARIKTRLHLLDTIDRSAAFLLRLALAREETDAHRIERLYRALADEALSVFGKGSLEFGQAFSALSSYLFRLGLPTPPFLDGMLLPPPRTWSTGPGEMRRLPVPESQAPPLYSLNGLEARFPAGKRDMDQLADFLAPARQHYPALLEWVFSEAIFHGEKKWQGDYDSLIIANQGEPGQLRVLRERRSEAGGLELDGRIFRLTGQLHGPQALELKDAARDLARDLDEDWPRALPYWRRYVDLSRHWHGAKSKEHVHALIGFAEAAAWEEQADLAMKTIGQARGLAQGDAELAGAVREARKAIAEALTPE